MVEIHGDEGMGNTYAVCNLSAGNRLLPVDYLAMAPLPEGDAQPKRIVVTEGGRKFPGTVDKHSLNGKDFIQFDGMNGVRCCDLSTMKYCWARSQVADHPPSAAAST